MCDRDVNICIQDEASLTLTRFTSWHAIWRASEKRTRDSVRGDAG